MTIRKHERLCGVFGPLLVLSCLMMMISSPLVMGQDNNDFVENKKNGTRYANFVAYNDTMTCGADPHYMPFNKQIRGVNLGGWMVLEPWLTPSLFYQFLGRDETSTAMDMYSFCDVLGPDEANKQLRRHWEAWVTEDIIDELYKSGAVNSLRLPVGDWMYKPYGPYVGCTDGALDYVDRVLDWANKRGMNVLLDIHGLRGSQNGFDNSGQTLGFQWTSVLNTEPAGLVTFEHWPIRTASWIGEFDMVQTRYKSINYENIRHALDVVQAIIDIYKNHPAVLGLEPVNEPWQFTPLEELKKYYWDGYLMVKRDAPHWRYVIHDSFRFDPSVWGGFMKGCPDRAMDTHIYQAWFEPASRIAFYNNACSQKNVIAKMEREFGPVIVGEWSLATDNCAMWLNGFNDNLPGFPRLPCRYIPCAEPYMGYDQPGTPVDPSKGPQGPYGSGMSGPVFGTCPIGRSWLKLSSDNDGDWMRAPPEAPKHRDATDEVMTKLAQKKINAFVGYGHGFYFWNFRTELDDPAWSYLLAVRRGWIPNGNLWDDVIVNACNKEDEGLFVCVTKRGMLETSIQNGVKYAMNVQGEYNNTWVDGVHGEDLYVLANQTFADYWRKFRVDGATCDFGGIAQLEEMNRTDVNYDDDFYNDDEYFPRKERLWHFAGYLAIGLVVGSALGFCVAMRMSKSFNRRVSSSRLLRPISKSKIFRASFGGFDDLYEKVPDRPQSRPGRYY